MSAAALFGLFALFAVVAGLVLYSLVRSEAENTERMSREEARERVSGRRDDS
ncbi:hypothetical protein [Halobacterium sp. R2-5]|uniref:hypothetical protein n=1 Tax=Halobacterium sp. R2-5 TaxID=2715751 RepID=UPI001423D3F3|nr:hypothetical protein [Halobacterium sp. R2-5]NIB99904.1 hypothetical protein [Halobacterium sp. R2-5]